MEESREAYNALMKGMREGKTIQKIECMKDNIYYEESQKLARRWCGEEDQESERDEEEEEEESKENLQRQLEEITGRIGVSRKELEKILDQREADDKKRILKLTKRERERGHDPTRAGGKKGTATGRLQTLIRLAQTMEGFKKDVNEAIHEELDEKDETGREEEEDVWTRKGQDPWARGRWTKQQYTNEEARDEEEQEDTRKGKRKGKGKEKGKEKGKKAEGKRKGQPRLDKTGLFKVGELITVQKLDDELDQMEIDSRVKAVIGTIGELETTVRRAQMMDTPEEIKISVIVTDVSTKAEMPTWAKEHKQEVRYMEFEREGAKQCVIMSLIKKGDHHQWRQVEHISETKWSKQPDDRVPVKITMTQTFVTGKHWTKYSEEPDKLIPTSWTGEGYQSKRWEIKGEPGNKFVRGYLQISKEREEGLLKRSGRKREDGGPIVYCERPWDECKLKDDEEDQLKYWVPTTEGETRQQYAEKVSDVARIAEEETGKVKPIIHRALEGKCLGIKRWHKPLGPNNITFMMKGCPQEWSPEKIMEFLTTEGYPKVGRLSPPASRAQGWLFTAEIAEENQAIQTQTRIVKNEETGEVITIKKHERKSRIAEGERIWGVRTWTMVEEEPRQPTQATKKNEEETKAKEEQERKESERKKKKEEKEQKRKIQEVEREKQRKEREKTTKEKEEKRKKQQEDRNKRKEAAEKKNNKSTRGFRARANKGNDSGEKRKGPRGTKIHQ